MSRLDDELRVAFKRKEPSAGFAERVLARLDEPRPIEKPSWRERLALIFAPPALRWATVGAAAMLVIAIAAMWQFAPRPALVETEPQVAAKPDSPATGTSNEEAANKTEAHALANETAPAPSNTAPTTGGEKVMPRKHRSNFVARRAEPKVDPEAEAAKQQVLFALKIANDAMTDVQRAIQQDSHNSKPERERNR